jgi:uncharacterized membrane protein YfcA
MVLALLMGSVLGLLGGGGSLLTVPLLTYAENLSASEAIATSLLVVGTTSLVALVPHALAGHVHFRTGLVLGIFGMGGAYFGGRTAEGIDGDLLLSLFAVLMVATAVLLLRQRKLPRRRSRFEVWQVALAGLLVGCVSGLLGAGGGFLVVPILTLGMGVRMREAIGTSLLVITLQSFAGFAAHAGHTQIPVSIAVLVTVAAVMGAVAGGVLARRVSADRLRVAFAGFVLLVALVMLLDHLPPLLMAFSGT